MSVSQLQQQLYVNCRVQFCSQLSSPLSFSHKVAQYYLCVYKLVAIQTSHKLEFSPATEPFRSLWSGLHV